MLVHELIPNAKKHKKKMVLYPNIDFRFLMSQICKISEQNKHLEGTHLSKIINQDNFFKTILKIAIWIELEFAS